MRCCSLYVSLSHIIKSCFFTTSETWPDLRLVKGLIGCGWRCGVSLQLGHIFPGTHACHRLALLGTFFECLTTYLAVYLPTYGASPGLHISFEVLDKVVGQSERPDNRPLSRPLGMRRSRCSAQQPSSPLCLLPTTDLPFQAPLQCASSAWLCTSFNVPKVPKPS